MFQNISFPFLSALALISWTILCYLHFVDEPLKSDDYDVEIYTDRPQYCPIQSNPSRTYDLLLSYGLILVVTVALSKLLKFLETSNILQKESANLPVEPKKQIENETETEKSPSFYLQHNLELKEQLDDLQTRCQELLQELRIGKNNTNNNNDDLEKCNQTFKTSLIDSDISSMSSDYAEDNSGVIMWKQPVECKSSLNSVLQMEAEVASPMTQNVYVTHSHIHINFNGSVRLSQQNLNINSLQLKDRPRSSEFRQVWGKYLKGCNEIPMITGIHNILM